VGALMVLGIEPDPGMTWPEFVWARHSAFYDVTTGSNGTCATSYFCTAGAGYDGPTGWGTLDGEVLQQAATGSDAGGDAAPAADAAMGADAVAGADANTGGDATAGADANTGGRDAAGPAAGDANAAEGVDAAAAADGAVGPAKEAGGGPTPRDASVTVDAAVADGRPAVEAAGSDAEVQASLSGDAAIVDNISGGGNSGSGCACAIVRSTDHGLANLASALVIGGTLALRRRGPRRPTMARSRRSGR
jgi:hypothetical protein